MNAGNQLVSTGKIVTGLAPIDANASAVNSDYVSLKDYHHVTFITQFGVAAAGTPNMTFSQAKNVAGGSAKAMPFDIYYLNSDTTASDTLVSTAVVSDTVAKVAGSAQKFVVEFDAAELDVDNGFDCIRCNWSTPGSNATLIMIEIVGSQSRYAGAASNPSMIID